jgi:hypothetical protein
MPRLPIDYSRNLIYKLVCNDLSICETYTGHTTAFIKRKNSHRQRCCNANDEKYNLKVYQVIRANGGWENWSMIEIEKYPCVDLNEACTRERYWYESLNSQMNTRVPIRTKQEYYVDNAVEISEKAKQYYTKNSEKITCDCGSIITKYRLTQHLKSQKHINFINSSPHL